MFLHFIHQKYLLALYSNKKMVQERIFWLQAKGKMMQNDFV